MKKKVLIICLCITICLAAAVGFVAFAAGENAANSLLSLSYLKTIFIDPFTKQTDNSVKGIKDTTDALADDAIKQYEDNAGKRIEEAFQSAVADKVVDRVTRDPSLITEAGGGKYIISKGDRVLGYTGGGVTLISGEATVCGNGKAEVLNTSSGAVLKSDAIISTGVYYMLLDTDNSGVEIVSDSAEVLIKDGSYIVKAYTARFEEYADKLFELELFKGTNSGYELERAPTRQEALIMLIRLLGEENAALEFDEKNMTFEDVTGWTDGRKYIAYGAYKKYTNGRSATVFDQGSTADAYMYLTFVLRSLGYSDAEGGDFIWNTTSLDLAVSLGLITQEERSSMGITGLRRDHVVLISYNALKKNLKGQSITLADKLVASGVLTREQASSIK